MGLNNCGPKFVNPRYVGACPPSIRDDDAEPPSPRSQLEVESNLQSISPLSISLSNSLDELPLSQQFYDLPSGPNDSSLPAANQPLLLPSSKSENGDCHTASAAHGYAG
jgi:hypothetical protein